QRQGDARMATASAEIEYRAAGSRYVGFLCASDTFAGRRPGVLVAPAGMGLGENAKSAASRLADLGYAAFAMDYYGDGAMPPPEELNGRLGALRDDPDRVRTIAAAALGVLATAPQT